MKYLHTMVRVSDLDASLDFYCNQLGLRELSRKEVEAGRFTLVFLAAPGDEEAQVELTHNWGTENDEDFAYHNGNDEPQGFGHIVNTASMAGHFTTDSVVQAIERTTGVEPQVVAHIGDQLVDLAIDPPGVFAQRLVHIAQRPAARQHHLQPLARGDLQVALLPLHQADLAVAVHAHRQGRGQHADA